MALLPCEQAVLLDTQVFDAVRLDFSNRNLVHLAELARSGVVQVLVTTVIYGEVSAHIRIQAQEASEHLEKVARHPFMARHDSDFRKRYSSPPMEAELYNAGIASFKQFLTNAGCQTVEVEPVDVTHVFSDYFDGKPPFGKGKKKSEFPDAFSLHAIRRWAAKYKMPVTVVSQDGDHEKFCEQHEELKAMKQLTTFLAQFPDRHRALEIQEWLDERWPDVEEIMANQIERLRFDLVGTDGEVSSVKVTGMDVFDRAVVEIAEDFARVACEIEVTLKAEIYAFPPMGNSYGGAELFEPEPYKEEGQTADTLTTTIDIMVNLDNGTSKPVEIDRVEIVGHIYPEIHIEEDWTGYRFDPNDPYD